MSKSVHQTINAPVHGHVAGGNITVSQTIIQRPLWQLPTPEEVLRHKVPKVCHDQLDQILNTADVTASEVLSAWRANALACKDSKIVRQWTKLDFWFGMFFLAVLAPYFLVSGVALCWPTVSDPSWLKACLVFSSITSVMTIAAAWILTPQRTARRAMRALGK